MVDNPPLHLFLSSQITVVLTLQQENFSATDKDHLRKPHPNKMKSLGDQSQQTHPQNHSHTWGSGNMAEEEAEKTVRVWDQGVRSEIVSAGNVRTFEQRALHIQLPKRELNSRDANMDSQRPGGLDHTQRTTGHQGTRSRKMVFLGEELTSGFV